jgi:hypothetical protein
MCRSIFAPCHNKPNTSNPFFNLQYSVETVNAGQNYVYDKYNERLKVTIRSLVDRGLLYFINTYSTDTIMDRSADRLKQYSKFETRQGISYSDPRSIHCSLTPVIPPGLADLLQLDLLKDMMLSVDVDNKAIAQYLAKSQKLLSDFTLDNTYEDYLEHGLSMPGVKDVMQKAMLPTVFAEMVHLGFCSIMNRASPFWNYYEFCMAIDYNYDKFIDWCEDNMNDCNKSVAMDILLHEPMRHHLNKIEYGLR